MMRKTIACLVILGSSFGCITAVHAQINRDCRALPMFLNKSGLDPKSSALSTSDRKQMGLIATEVNYKPGKTPKTYQHPSWKKAGWLGPMVITEKGDVWVAPVPMINTNFNKPKDQNGIWKVNGQTGEMALALELPIPDIKLDNQNPYGLMGLGYDCDNRTLYASSVAGSTPDMERGAVYAIRTDDLAIVDKMGPLDAFGLGVGTIGTEKRLYYGRSRSSDIFSIGLSESGTFSGKPRLELSLNDLGPRGDDMARKIRFSPDGTMTVTGVEFYFNLTAPTEKQESSYQFKYDPSQAKWVLTGLQ